MGVFRNKKLTQAEFTLAGKDIQSIEGNTVSGRADWLKKQFDAAAEEVIAPRINEILDLLEDAAAGASAAQSIGSEAIMPGSGTTVRDQLVYVLGQVQLAIAGDIVDGALTDAKLSNAAGMIKARVAELFGSAQRVYKDLSETGATPENTLKEVIALMPDYSRLVIDWVGTDYGDYAGTTFGNDMPGTAGTLTVTKAEGTHPAKAEFYQHGEAMSFERVYAAISGTDYDSGWNEHVPAARRINGYDLTKDRALTYSDVAAAPAARKINGYDLTADRTLTAHDISYAQVIYNSLSQISGASTSKTLLEVIDLMTNFSTLTLDWTGKSGTGYSGTTFGNDMPAAFGTLFVKKAKDTHVHFALFATYNTGGIYVRYYDRTNSTHDSGWMEITQPIATGTLSYTTANFTNASSRLEKAGHDVTLTIIGSAAKDLSSNAQLMTIPAGFRPTGAVYGWIYRQKSGSNDVYSEAVSIGTNGVVTRIFGGTAQSGNTLRGTISFKTA